MATMALFGAMVMSSGCISTDEKLKVAAETIGRTQAKTELPETPSECRRHMDRVFPKIGEKVRWTQKRWEFAADNIDGQIDRCAAFNDDTREKFR